MENPSRSEIIKRRKEETCFRNYGVKNPCFLAKTKVRSAPEDELFQYVKSCVCESCIVIPNDRTQMVPNNRNNWKANHELDIWIPELNLAIEFQGVFWHDPSHFPQNAYNDEEKRIKYFNCFKSVSVSLFYGVLTVTLILLVAILKGWILVG